MLTMLFVFSRKEDSTPEMTPRRTGRLRQVPSRFSPSSIIETVTSTPSHIGAYSSSPTSSIDAEYSSPEGSEYEEEEEEEADEEDGEEEDREEEAYYDYDDGYEDEVEPDEDIQHEESGKSFFFSYNAPSFFRVKAKS